MGKLTDIQIRTWRKAGDPIAGKSDGGGLTFTLSKAGTAAWVFRFRHSGKAREATIGNYPDITLQDARAEATKLRAQVDLGIDVAGEKRKTKLAQRLAKTLEELCQQYLELAAPKLKEATRKEVARYLSKDVYPRIGKLPAKDVTAREVVHVVEQVAKRSQSVARRTFETLSVIFGFGVARHALTRNPCADLRVSAILGETKPRRPRVMLTEDELRVILPSLPLLGKENALAIKILLATCTRKSELIKARWEHLNGDLWTIPAENAKNGKSFVIPLPVSVMQWFEELRAIAGDSPFVLPARKRGYGKKSETISRDTLNEAINRAKLGDRHFSPHDLRSTARSHLAAKGVNIIVAERCLNHDLGGLIGIYDKYDYLDERRSALELWASFLEECETGTKRDMTNVVALHG
jgi:integrase